MSKNALPERPEHRRTRSPWRERARLASGVALVAFAFAFSVALRALADEPASIGAPQGPLVWGAAENVMQLRHLYFAAQPDAAGFAAAREAGVDVVIDLRDPSERDWDEASVVRAAGMTYYNVPVSGDRFDPGAFEQIEALVARSEGRPTLLHCFSANRVGAWLATHLVTRHDLSEAEALARGRQAGITKPAIEERVHRYLRERRAREALAPLKKNLMGTLKGVLADGPEAALVVCQQAAPAITAAAQQPRAAIGRTSHRTRNPANDPEAWMQPLLEHYLATPREASAPRMVDLGERGTGYVEPIYLQESCLACHGGAIDPTLRRRILERYPDDRAVGFAVGELRGLFWAVLADEDVAKGDSARVVR